MQTDARTLPPHRFVLFAAIVAALLWMADGPPNAAADPRADEPTVDIDAVFSPDGGCAHRIITEIESARKAIHVQAFIFTSNLIADALVDAAEHGIDVTVILDDKQKKQRYSKWRRLKKGGVSVHFDSEHATANNKIMLIDNTTIITGSYNYSKAAESRNAENIVIIKNDKRLFAKYRENFEEHMQHSK
jgi:phosphatidylserine/phosphatidylglycerophosphate/cardiolipin synthase-like enzyme